MVDRERFLDLLVGLSEALEDLERYRDSVSPEDLTGDRDKRNMVLHALLVAIQSSIDLAQHLIAENKLIRPDTYRQAFEILKEAGLLEGGLAERLEDLAGFRNVLVHVYANLDLKRVHQILIGESLALAELRLEAEKMDNGRGVDSNGDVS